MSVSYSVFAIMSPEDKAYKAHKAVWDACEAAKVDIPEDTLEFFDHCTPDPGGVKVYMKTNDHALDYEWCMDIKVADIPKDATVISFRVS